MNKNKNSTISDSELALYRKEFPVVDNCVYLDHAGVAPVPVRTIDKVKDLFEEFTGWGVQRIEGWEEEINRIRALSAEFIGAQADEVAFVKNTSHGISIIAEGIDWKKGDNVITFEKEFPSNIYPWMNLGRKGVELRYIPFNDGKILLDDIENLIDSRTRLLSISSVQSVNGFLIDLKSLGELCNDRGVLFLIDAIQSLGAVPMDVKEFGIDFLAADGHKWLLAPEGTGVFYCRKELAGEINPNLIGWKSVVHEYEFEKIELDLKQNAERFEEGSYNTMGIYALGGSVSLLAEVGVNRVHQRVLDLGDLIMEQARERSFHIKTPESRAERGGIVSFSGEFNEKKLAEWLKEIDVVVNQRGGALRVSPHFYNTEEEILRLFSHIDNILKL